MKIKNIKNKGQEEIVGFGLIIIIVSIILLVFLGFSLRDSEKDAVESYEVDSFIQAFLQYTTDCRDNLEYLSVQKLIFDCDNKEKCADERDACEVLNLTLTEIAEESWGGEDSPTKGYELKILSNEEEILLINKGNATKNYKGGVQDFSKIGTSVEIYFTAYS